MSERASLPRNYDGDISREPGEWPRVRTQMSARKGHPVRYGYVITETDGSSWVSEYRWQTAEAAQRAGEVDVDACRAGL